MTREECLQAMVALTAEEVQLRAANGGKLTRHEHIALIHAWAALQRAQREAVRGKGRAA